MIFLHPPPFYSFLPLFHPLFLEKNSHLSVFTNSREILYIFVAFLFCLFYNVALIVDLIVFEAGKKV